MDAPKAVTVKSSNNHSALIFDILFTRINEDETEGLTLE